MAPTPTQEFLADARKRMVESQLRPNKVTDARILAAMRALPREAFLPPSLLPLAYSDQNVVLGAGRVLMQPMTLARLIQAAAPLPGERVLVIAAATGYAAAVFASIGCAVTALEEPGALADMAKTALAAIAPGTTVVTGPLSAGWPAAGPYDTILIDGAVPEIPAALAQQLNKETGRLVAIAGTGGHTGHAVIARPTAGGLAVRALFDCLCPEIPSLTRAPAFEF